MVEKKRSFWQRFRLSEKQTSIPANPYEPSVAPQSVPNYMPNNNALAPNQRPDYQSNPVNPNTGMQPFARTPFPSAAGATATSTSGQSIFDNGQGKDNNGAFDSVKVNNKAIGNSGTQIFGGYFSEEYLKELTGRRGARMWDEMRRSEAQISMLMNAIKNPIKSANWDFEAFDESDPEMVKHKELVEACIKDMIDFEKFKTEALTVIEFGFTALEKIHSVVLNHPKFGTFNGLKALAFRSQKTIENWQLEPKTGRLLGINQYTYSDLGGNQFIPGEFLLIITHLQEGDNYEGISALRPMLGAYKRKELYLKLAAIGIERSAIGTPLGTVPVGKEKTTEYDRFTEILQNFTSHESSFITKPAGWDVEILKMEFDASKVKEMLVFENTEFANAVVGNFLALGMNGGGGAYALGSNLGEFFTSGIQAYADLITNAINRDVIPDLVKLNFGEQRGYPKLKCTGISDKAGKELAETIKFLVDARSIDPDKPLKAHLRKLYKLPKPDPESATALPAIPAGASANYPKPNDPIVNPETGKIEPFTPNQLVGDQPSPQAKHITQTQLVEEAKTIRLSDKKKYLKRFDNNKQKIKALMQEQLTEIYSDLKDVIRRKYNAASDSSKLSIVKGLEAPGRAYYKKVLKQALGEVGKQSYDAAKKLVPARHKLSEGDYDALPPQVRKLIDAQAELIVETQLNDIEKQVFFQFASTATTSDDIDDILNDIDEKVEASIDGSTKEGMSVDVAAGDAVAHVTQQSSLSFLMDSDVSEGIESFTFTNEDPVSECCQELAGSTFAVGDADLDRYTPPLHHNCKSRLVPNFKGDPENPEIGEGDAQENGGVSLSKAALKAITLSDWVFEEIK